MWRQVGRRLACRFAGVDGMLRDADMAALSRPATRRRVARESFGSRQDSRRKDKEEKVMAMPFDKLTQELKQGHLNFKDLEVERIEREKNRLANEVEQAEAASKKTSSKVEVAKKRIDELDQVSSKLIENNTPENIHFPWQFSSEIRGQIIRKEGSIKSTFPFLHLMTEEIMTHYMKSFVVNLIDKEWDFLEDVAEPLLVKNLKKEMALLPSKYKLICPNLKTSKFIFDLYEVRNIFMSSINTNRKKSDSLHNYYVSQEVVEGKNVYLLNKKRPGESDECGYVMQFCLNVYTDLRLQVVDSQGNVVLEDKALEDRQYQTKELTQLKPHNVEIEIMACKGKLKTLRKASQEGLKSNLSDSITNFMTKRNFRIIDFDNFMGGNQLLVGLEWARISEIIQQNKRKEELELSASR